VKPKQLESLLDAKTQGRDKAVIPPEPNTTAAGLAHGKQLFTQNCATCHGADGMGMQKPEWKTEEGYPIASRNFTSNIFKGGGRGRDLYQRVYSGIPGTPMPGFSGSASPADIWDIVHYVQSLAIPRAKTAAMSPAAAPTPSPSGR
jgi:mono/diheme cytochrome c family protein